jgi:hypothetical protein
LLKDCCIGFNSTQKVFHRLSRYVSAAHHHTGKLTNFDPNLVNASEFSFVRKHNVEVLSLKWGFGVIAPRFLFLGTLRPTSLSFHI